MRPHRNTTARTSRDKPDSPFHSDNQIICQLQRNTEQRSFSHLFDLQPLQEIFERDETVRGSKDFGFGFIGTFASRFDSPEAEDSLRGWKEGKSSVDASFELGQKSWGRSTHVPELGRIEGLVGSSEEEWKDVCSKLAQILCIDIVKGARTGSASRTTKIENGKEEPAHPHLRPRADRNLLEALGRIHPLGRVVVVGDEEDSSSSILDSTASDEREKRESQRRVRSLSSQRRETHASLNSMTTLSSKAVVEMAFSRGGRYSVREEGLS